MAKPQQQPQAPDIVSRMAMLVATAERNQREGRPTRPEVMREMQQIEAQAKANLSPEQFQRATQLVNQQKVHIMQADSQNQISANQHREQQQLVKQLRSGTKDLGVGELENFEQFQQVRKGETITKKTKKNRMDVGALTKAVKDKHGTSLDEHLKRLDEVADAELSNPDSAPRLREKYGFDEQTTKEWRQGGGLDFTMSQRQAEADKDVPDEEEITPDKADIRHADVMFGAAEHDIDPSDTIESFVDANQDLLNEDSMHGDIARSMMSHEE